MATPANIFLNESMESLLKGVVKSVANNTEETMTKTTYLGNLIDGDNGGCGELDKGARVKDVGHDVGHDGVEQPREPAD